MGSAWKAVAAAALSVVLAACGGGGDDSPASEGSTSVSDAQVVANVKSSNIDFLPANRPAGTWRWSGTPTQRIAVYVPDPVGATEQDYAAKAATAITVLNAKLAGLLVLERIDSIPTSGNYIQVSYGTAYVPPGSTDYASYCANVSTGMGLGNVIIPDSQNGIASSTVYVNLGNGRCNVTQDIVTHEFAHALGLNSHFSGFGNDGPVSAMFDALATLYGNAQSTTASNLVVKRATN